MKLWLILLILPVLFFIAACSVTTLETPVAQPSQVTPTLVIVGAQSFEVFQTVIEPLLNP